MTDAERILDFFKKSGLTEKIQKQRQADLISSVSDHHIDTPHWDYYTEISSLLPLYPEFTQFLKEMGISPMETLRSRIQCLVLNQLNNAYLIAASRTGIAAGGCIAVIAAGAAAAAGSHRECHGAGHQRCE